MAYRLLRREGWSVNHKRVQRLWREEGLQRPISRKRKRAWPADGSVRRHRADHPHQVWAMDFQFDATADGRRLKFLNVIDEHSRLCLAISVHPVGQRAGLHRPGSTELVRRQHHHQHGLHRAGVTMGERLCRVLQRPLPG